ncbi:MAG: prepilin peptidase [Elusimicrobia bacterium]|nr:prepilin peptidase [Elusimicrobiota bacterium]
MGFLAFAWGACLGSFANVLIQRLPKQQSVVSPRSRCPHCRKAIAWHDNLPVFSWLALKGRCRSCRARISPRYPAVEAAGALLSLGLWLRWGDFPWVAAASLAATALLAIALIDWDTFLIPDELSLGLLVLGWIAAPVNPYLLEGFSHRIWAFAWSLLGSAVGFLLCWGVAWVGEKIFKREAMGGGDVKLLAAVGAWSGGLGAFDCLMLGSLLGAAYGAPQMLQGRLKRFDPIPFGPFLSAAALFNLFWLLPLGFPFAY